MILVAKESFDKDVDEIKTIFQNLDEIKKNDLFTQNSKYSQFEY